MTKPKTLDQLRAEKERAETQLAQEQHMVSVYPIWKADHHTGQPRRGQDILCHASCGGLHQPKALARYGDP